MEIKKYYYNLIIMPLELEIKAIKKKLNKKINFTREIDKEYLSKLQTMLHYYYQRYYELNNKE